METLTRLGRLRDRQRGGIFFRLISLLVFVVLLLIVYLVRVPILRVAGNFWVVNDTPQPSDAIAVLGDDNYNGDRAARAAELFKAGWAPRVIASGRYLRSYATISELEAHDLADHGVPPGAIVRFAHQATDTKDECADMGQLMTQHGWKRLLLVTSTYHTRRSRYICERLLPPGTVLRVEAAPDSDYDPDNWWRTRGGMKAFFHETVGIFVAMWELRHDDVRTTQSFLLNSPQAPRAGLSSRASPIDLQLGVSVL